MADIREDVTLDKTYTVICTNTPNSGPYLMNSRGLVTVNGTTLGTWERVPRGDFMVSVPNVSKFWGATPIDAAVGMVTKLQRAGRLNALIG